MAAPGKRPVASNLKVKNTFITVDVDVNQWDSMDDRFEDDEDWNTGAFSRMATEPGPSTIKLLESPLNGDSSGSMSVSHQVGSLDVIAERPGEDRQRLPSKESIGADSVGGSEVPEPETESDHCQKEDVPRKRHLLSDAVGPPSVAATAMMQGMSANSMWPLMGPPMGYPAATGASSSSNVDKHAAARLAVTAAVSDADGFAKLQASWNHVLTVMMRNLPNKVTQQQLLSEMDDAGFLHTYDFVYLPIDQDTSANRGYAFVNFATPGMALIFKMHFEGQKFCQLHSNKVVSVVPAVLQGFEANYAHYSSTHVKHRDTGARPLFLREPRFDASQPGGCLQSYESMIDAASRQVRKQMPQLQLQLQQLQQLQQQRQQVFHASSVAGSHVTTSKPTPPVASGKGAHKGASESPVARFCHNCGGSIQAHFKFCKNCGAETLQDDA